MKKHFFFLIISLFSSLLFSQNSIIKVNDLHTKKAILSSLSGEKISFIDTISISNGSEFDLDLETTNTRVSIVLPSTIKPGWTSLTTRKK